MLLLAFLGWRGRVPAAIDQVGSTILQHLGLLFVPASVGVLRELSADEAQVRGTWAKSVTASIGMGIAERIQPPPTLTAIVAVSTGVLSAMVLPVVVMRGG